MAANDDARPMPSATDFDAILNSITAEDIQAAQRPPERDPQQQQQPQPATAPGQPSGSPDFDAILNSITLDDVRQQQQAPQAAPGGGSGSGGEQPSLLHRVANSLSPFDATKAALAVPGSETIGTAMESAAFGAAKAGIELKDLVAGGDPSQADKSTVRQWIEHRSDELRRESLLNGVAQGVAQFGVGFIGLGKIGLVAKGLEKAAKAGRFAHWTAETGRAAVAGATVIDPHDERLSNLVQQYPALRNPVSAYLAAKPDDSEAEGRFKNALEGIGIDAGLGGALALATKGIRYFRAGDVEAANKVAAEADEAFANPAKAPDAPQGPTAPLRDDSTGLNVSGGQQTGGTANEAGSVRGGAVAHDTGDVPVLDSDARDARGVSRE